MTDTAHGSNVDADPPVWTYPTRFCRICREDVAPTVTLYPPGIPLQYQRPIVEYKNDDEYGRLIKPCMCRGSSRYIHELCLLRTRTEVQRANSLWKCHECGHKFNFQKLFVTRFLGSSAAAGVLTVFVLIALMFFLGFVADPIINLYLDPYHTIVGEEDAWDRFEIRTSGNKAPSGWTQHFVKGMISMGVVGFVKTMVMNPLHWWNFRNSGLTGTRTTTTGRDRAANISWIVILIGVSSAFYFFYKWVQLVIQKSLQRLGNHIVDTQLPGDDDDLKPPPGWKYQPEPTTEDNDEDQDISSSNLNRDELDKSETPGQATPSSSAGESDGVRDEPVKRRLSDVPAIIGGWPTSNQDNVGRSSAIDAAQSQSWSFSDL